MSTLNWDELLADLRGDDVDRALAATEAIAAQVTDADLPRVYALAEDEDYFVRVMAGDILAKTAGIAALPTLLGMMLRNEEEGFENDGLDEATKHLMRANPITARTALLQFAETAHPGAKALADWGLADLPEERTVVTPMVATPTSPPPPSWRRSCLGRLGIGAAVLLLLGLVWGYVPAEVGKECTAGHHAAWISVDWTSQPVNPAAVRRLSDESRRYRLKYLYPYTTYLQEDGTFNDTYNHATEFVQQFREVNDDTQLLAWVGIPLLYSRGMGIQGWVDLSDAQQRAEIVTFVVELVEIHGFDGVHLNVETVWNEDADFLQLLDEVNHALPDGLLLSVAGSHWAPGILEPLDLRWSDTYYHEVATRVDQIATMTYDSRAPLPVVYRFWMREQVRGIRQSVTATDTELLVGISVSDESTPSHQPAAETLAAGLAGACASGDPAADGIALYAAWETDDSEWALWEEWTGTAVNSE